MAHALSKFPVVNSILPLTKENAIHVEKGSPLKDLKIVMIPVNAATI